MFALEKKSLKVTDKLAFLKIAQRNDVSHHIKYLYLKGAEIAILESVFAHLTVIGIFDGKMMVIRERLEMASYQEYFTSLEIINHQIFVAGTCGVRSIKLSC